jgi:MAF protein
VALLVLASTSAYRADLLARLALPFTQQAPDYIEAPLATSASGAPGNTLPETPQATARRHARGKCEAVDAPPPGAWTIGSDQVLSADDGTVLHKPGNFTNALAQLDRCCGHWMTATTAIALRRDDGVLHTAYETFSVRLRTLSAAQTRDYLDTDRPWDCAGSIRAEGHGIRLLAESVGRDVCTFYGLPLMLLTDMLSAMGHPSLRSP